MGHRVISRHTIAEVLVYLGIDEQIDGDLTLRLELRQIGFWSEVIQIMGEVWPGRLRAIVDASRQEVEGRAGWILKRLGRKRLVNH